MNGIETLLARLKKGPLDGVWGRNGFRLVRTPRGVKAADVMAAQKQLLVVWNNAKLQLFTKPKKVEIKRGDIKRYREFLNAQDDGVPHKHNQFHQLTRKYGDYLYNQDREKFMVDLVEWLAENQ